MGFLGLSVMFNLLFCTCAVFVVDGNVLLVNNGRHFLGLCGGSGDGSESGGGCLRNVDRGMRREVFRNRRENVPVRQCEAQECADHVVHSGRDRDVDSS